MSLLKKISRVGKPLELLSGKTGILRYRVPAKSFLYYPAYIAALVVVTLSSILAIPDLDNYKRIFTILTLNLGFSLVVLASLFIFNRLWTVKNRYGSIPISTIAQVGLILGGVKGALTWYALAQQGFKEEIFLGLIGRIMLSAAIGSFAAVSLLLFISFVYQYNQEREALLLKERILETGENYPAVLRNFIEHAKTEIRNIRKGSPGDANLASKIRRMVLEELRPLSLELWGRDVLSLPRLSLPEITKISISRYAYSFWIVPAWIFSSLPGTIEMLGSENAILAQSLRAVFLVLILYLLKRLAICLIKYGFLYSLLLHIFSIITVSTILVYSVSFFVEGRTFSADIGLIFLNILWIFQLSLTFGYVKSILGLSEKLKEIKDSYSDEELRIVDARQAARLEDRRIAQFLHGHVQSKLVSLADSIAKRGQLEEKINETDSQIDSESGEITNQLSEDLKEIEKVLDDALAAFSENSSTSISEALEQIDLDWGEIVKIEIHSPLEPNKETIGETQVGKVQEIINEGIANAVRHGLASEVSIYIYPSEIVIIDNGIGVKAGEKRLGSIFLDQVSPDWSLSNTDEGTTLRVPLTHLDT